MHNTGGKAKSFNSKRPSGVQIKKISEHLPQSLRFTYSNTPPTTTTTNTNNIMTQTGTEKAKEAAAAANVQGHAVAADLQAKVHTMLLPQQHTTIQSVARMLCVPNSTELSNTFAGRLCLC
jgi:hypothetical protein